MATLSDKIEHIVVLMLENRSFDSVLGELHPGRPDFDGLTGTETNPLYGGADIPVWNNPGLDSKSMSIPNPDPGELWNDINMQLYGLTGKADVGVPRMDGFVDNYAHSAETGQRFHQKLDTQTTATWTVGAKRRMGWMLFTPDRSPSSIWA